MNTGSSDDTGSPTHSARPGSRWRFELIFGSFWLAVGLFLVPVVIYWVGTTALGPYSEKARLGTFYGAFFADLASGAARTWLLALGPLLLVSAVRVLFIGSGRSGADDEQGDEDVQDRNRKRAAAAENRRIEPRVGG
jgi:hypothetical protein